MINSNTNKLDDQIKQKLKFRISEVTSKLIIYFFKSYILL